MAAPADGADSGIPKMKLHKLDQLRILAFGDSLAEGYTDFGMLMHPYGPALHSKLTDLLPDFGSKITIDVEGQSGDCVLNSLGGEFEDRLLAAAASGEPAYDLVIILGDTNDLAYKRQVGLEGAKQIFERDCSCLTITF